MFYRVGGCVRDSLLGRESEDIDWAVVGESPESMKSAGFIEVGAFTPVFIHPVTGDEYALARRERTTGPGHNDFAYEWKGVTLEEDLFRRDLTINSMAEDVDGTLIDPHGGREDLEAGILRHVSAHFMEDPLRILRVARFASRLNFSVAAETVELMRGMVDQGMLGYDSDGKTLVSGERYWSELSRALCDEHPERFFEVLDSCGALQAVFPEIKALQGIPQRVDYHAEGDAYIHTMMVLKEAVALTEGLERDRMLRIRFAAITHDLGKAMTPHKFLYHEDGSIKGAHPGHESKDVFGPQLKSLCTRTKVPTAFVKFAYAFAQSHQSIHAIGSMTSRGLINLHERLGGGRVMKSDIHYLKDLSIAAISDANGRLYLMDGVLTKPGAYPQSDHFHATMEVINAIPEGEIMKKWLEKGHTLEQAKSMVTGAKSKALTALLNKIKEQGLEFPR